MGCKYCGRENEGNAFDYYHQADCEARAITERIQRIDAGELSDWFTAKALVKERARLVRLRDQARYVGD